MTPLAIDPIDDALARSDSSLRSPRMFDAETTDAVAGTIHWSPIKSLWISAMSLLTLCAAPACVTPGAVILFLVTTGVTICLGHSLGMHRRLIHRAYDCPIWLERLFVYLGTLVGLSGPLGMIRQHDIRDWAQRKPLCHSYLAHRARLPIDGFRQLHCDLRLDHPPRLVLERRVATDLFYRVLQRSWMAQQLPWALLFLAVGGLPWVVWGIAVRIAVSVTGHWLIGWFAHNQGQRSWHLRGAAVQGYNVRWCGLVTMGEAWHNNHHAYPASARLGLDAGQGDPGWWVLCALRRAGLVWNVKTPDMLPARPDLLACGGTRSVTRTRSFLAHFVAGGVALLFAWRIAHTAYYDTGLLFIAPLAIILSLHLLWIGLSRGFVPGYARIALSRMLTTAIAIAVVAVLAAIFAPMPAAAEPSNAIPILGVILFSLACLAVLAGVIVVAALIVRFAAIRLTRAARGLRRRNPDSAAPDRDDDRLYDAGVIAMAFLIIVTASLEGVTPAFSFAAGDFASSSVAVAASPEAVWRQVGTATSPAFPLPAMLNVIPRPVAVLTDEGAGLGARRIVHFAGRQGAGDLVLQVVRRSDAETEFKAVSDTTPIAKWVRQQALIFHVEPSASGSLLTVSLRYDRLLAPAWFFRPFIHTVAGFAVDVLARDTRDRAEPR